MVRGHFRERKYGCKRDSLVSREQWVVTSMSTRPKVLGKMGLKKGWIKKDSASRLKNSYFNPG